MSTSVSSTLSIVSAASFSSLFLAGLLKTLTLVNSKYRLTSTFLFMISEGITGQ